MEKTIEQPPNNELTTSQIVGVPGSLSFKARKYYFLDATKIKTVEDVARILVSLNIGAQKGSQYFETLKPYLKVDEDDNDN